MLLKYILKIKIKLEDKNYLESNINLSRKLNLKTAKPKQKYNLVAGLKNTIFWYKNYFKNN